MKIKELLNVTFDETPPPSKTSPLMDDDLDEVKAIRITEKKNLQNDIKDETLEIDEVVNIKESRNHPLENVIGNLNQRTLRLVAQGYNQQEGIDYDETYAPVARLESIRILLAYACALDFKLFQMDVKSAFLNNFINEEVGGYNRKNGVFQSERLARVWVWSRFDTAYQEFLGVGTTFDIFQNIHFLYLQYGVLVSSGYGVLIIFPSWSLVSAGTDTPYLP
ncbi:retrovirus-related pol polyprotein from transposon TNT 1-94 [Tanacetum coccineum]|uniref:Retrovirus-related pol polyprotein from transposon TNT 1-94 n=1 Tax=Tanacetum coccineum TaxID=301880 RepID=A0ABQ5GB14_9ASTR